MSKTEVTGDMNDLSDEELLKLFRSDNKDAYNILALRYKQRITSYLYRYSNGSPWCKDMVQEVLIIFYDYKDKVLEIRSFRQWIFKVAYNVANNHFSESSKNPFVSINENEDNDAYLHKYHRDEFIDEIPEFDRDETPLEILQRALDRISSAYKPAILLRYDQDLEYDEIAKILSIPEGTVKSRINRGREELKKLIAEEIKKEKTGRKE